MSRSRMRYARRGRRALVALALLVGACGPTVDVEVGVQHLATDILYGNTNVPTPAPVLPERTTSPGFPSFIAPPPPPPPPPPTIDPTPTPTPTPVDPCPEPGPFVFPAASANPSSHTPPSEGVYRFRSLLERTPTYPDDLLQRVENVEVASDGGFTYDVVAVQEGTRTTTSYEVTDQSSTDLVPGVYLRSIVTETDGDAQPDQFAPVTPIQVFALPAADLATWSSVGTDPLHQMSMAVEGTVVKRDVVLGCDEIFAAWETRVTVTVVAPLKRLEYAATYFVATQYGGLVLAYDVTKTGTDAGEEISEHAAAALNSITVLPDDEAGA